MKKHLLISILFLSFFSCDPLEVSIQDTFNFSIATEYQSSIKVNSIQPLVLNVTPEKIITGTKYFFMIETLEGNGTLMLNNEILQPNQEYLVNNLTQKFTFSTNEIGRHKIQFTIWNSNDKSQSHSIAYSAFDQNSFDFELLGDEFNVFYTETLPLDFELKEIDNGSQKELTYDLSYETENIETTLFLNDIEYAAGDIIKDIKPGPFRVLLKSGEAGKSTVKFWLTSSEGETKSQMREVLFEPNEFDFTFEPSSPQNIVSRGMSILLGIEQEYEENLIYTVNIIGQKGEILWRGIQNIPGTLTNVSQGNYNLIYYPSAVSDNDFLVNITASNGQKKTKRIPFEALPVNFNFEVSKSTIKLVNSENLNKLNDFVKISLNRPTDLAQREPKYFVTISSDVPSILINSGKNSLGEIIPLDDFSGTQNDTFNYGFLFGENVTNGEIIFTVRNETGYEVKKVVKVEVEKDS